MLQGQQWYLDRHLLRPVELGFAFEVAGGIKHDNLIRYHCISRGNSTSSINSRALVNEMQIVQLWCGSHGSGSRSVPSLSTMLVELFLGHLPLVCDLMQNTLVSMYSSASPSLRSAELRKFGSVASGLRITYVRVYFLIKR